VPVGGVGSLLELLGIRVGKLWREFAILKLLQSLRHAMEYMRAPTLRGAVRLRASLSATSPVDPLTRSRDAGMSAKPGSAVSIAERKVKDTESLTPAGRQPPSRGSVLDMTVRLGLLIN
jgi:hypothetical protein